jgi:hypothetical protein
LITACEDEKNDESEKRKAKWFAEMSI